MRTVTAALVLLACWAVTSTSWSPISRTTASTACSCRSVTADPPTTSAENPAAPNPTAPNPTTPNPTTPNPTTPNPTTPNPTTPNPTTPNPATGPASAL